MSTNVCVRNKPVKKLKKLKHRNTEPDILEPVVLERGSPLPTSHITEDAITNDANILQPKYTPTKPKK